MFDLGQKKAKVEESPLCGHKATDDQKELSLKPWRLLYLFQVHGKELC